MKMANGGFSPAYNAQLATDTKTRIVVGVSVTNSGLDAGQMSLMQEQIIKRYNIKPVRWLCDNGYYDHEDIDKGVCQFFCVNHFGHSKFQPFAKGNR